MFFVGTGIQQLTTIRFHEVQPDPFWQLTMTGARQRLETTMDNARNLIGFFGFVKQFSAYANCEWNNCSGPLLRPGSSSCAPRVRWPRGCPAPACRSSAGFRPRPSGRFASRCLASPRGRPHACARISTRITGMQSAVCIASNRPGVTEMSPPPARWFSGTDSTAWIEIGVWTCRKVIRGHPWPAEFSETARGYVRPRCGNRPLVNPRLRSDFAITLEYPPWRC